MQFWLRRGDGFAPIVSHAGLDRIERTETLPYPGTDVDYGLAEARTTFGRIGVKVWIYKGEILPYKSAVEDKIARAEIIDVSKLSGSVIKFGARVTLADEETDEEQTFQIVGEDEADISQGRLSVTSPLARALIGKQTGESVEVATPRGAKSYEVVTVAFG